MSDHTDLTIDVMAERLNQRLAINMDHARSVASYMLTGLTPGHRSDARLADIFPRLADATPGAAPGEGMVCSRCGNRRYVEWCPYCDGVIPGAAPGEGEVEAAAKAMFELRPAYMSSGPNAERWTWEKASPDSQTYHRENARAALNAARLASPSPARSDRGADRQGVPAYPPGVTVGDHIAHDIRHKRFPQQSSVEDFLRERAEDAATLFTCAHITDRGECVWHTRTWSEGIEPQRCSGCPDRALTDGVRAR